MSALANSHHVQPESAEATGSFVKADPILPWVCAVWAFSWCLAILFTTAFLLEVLVLQPTGLTV